jgi:hypothetical protein
MKIAYHKTLEFWDHYTVGILTISICGFVKRIKYEKKGNNYLFILLDVYCKMVQVVYFVQRGSGRF